MTMLRYNNLDLYDKQLKALNIICNRLLEMNGRAMKSRVPVDILSDVTSAEQRINEIRLDVLKKYNQEYTRVHAFDWEREESKWKI